jgi:hypothetical protein
LTIGQNVFYELPSKELDHLALHLCLGLSRIANHNYTQVLHNKLDGQHVLQKSMDNIVAYIDYLLEAAL